MTENYINHVVLTLDASYSMQPHAGDLIKVATSQIEHLARRSQELDQETRVSIYDFADDVRCLVYDKDVLRLPSIAGLYRPRGNTALIDATIKSLRDLAHTAQLYGDHAFLEFVLTDGEENRSRHTGMDLRRELGGLPEQWTVACLVPDQMSKHEAQGFGFAPANIAVWNPDARTGVEDAGAVIRQATESFMTNRAKGMRGTATLFSTGVDVVNGATVRAVLGAPMDRTAYDIIPVSTDDYIRPFVESRGLPYSIGQGYYQLTKTETIQNRKQIAVREKATGAVYAGPQARELLGLGGNDVRVKPDHNPAWDVFVQSTSVNRRLVAGTDLLVMR